MPAPMTAFRIARGICRRGSFVSSPSAAPPSKPPPARKASTTPSPTAEPAPDAGAVRELGQEEADLGGRPNREREVGAEQRPAGEEARPRAEGGAGERVDRAGMAVVAGKAHDPEGDEEDEDRRDQEGQRDRLADVGGHALAVQGHGGRPG